MIWQKTSHAAVPLKLLVSAKAGMPTTAVAPDIVGKPVKAGMSLTNRDVL
jgi:hypothetical protein